MSKRCCSVATSTDDNRQPATVEAQEADLYAEGGWGWVIAGSCFILTLIADGFGNSSGIFYVAIIDRFHRANGTDIHENMSTEVAWIMSLMGFVYLLVGPIASALFTTLGGRVTIIVGSLMTSGGYLISAFAPTIRILYFSMGILTASGLGVTYQAAVVVPNYYFLKRRGLVNGIVVCGSGVGTFVVPLLIHFFLENFGFQGAFLLLAGITLQGAVCGALILTPEVLLRMMKKKDKQKLLAQTAQLSVITIEDNSRENVTKQNSSTITSDKVTIRPKTNSSLACCNGKQKVGSNKNIGKSSFGSNLKKLLKASCDIKLLKSEVFIVIAIGQFLYNYGLATGFVFIPGRAVSLGLNGQQSSLLISIVGITSIISRIAGGVLADLKFASGKSLYIYAIGFILGGIGTVINYGPTFGHQTITSTLLGLCIGMVCCLTCPTLADVLGMEMLTKAFGMISFFGAFAALAAPAVSGWIFGMTGNYVIVFACSGTCLLLAGGILFLIPCMQYYKKHRKQSVPKQQTRDVGEINPTFLLDLNENTDPISVKL